MDTIPTEETVKTFAEHLLAELEQLSIRFDLLEAFEPLSKA